MSEQSLYDPEHNRMSSGRSRARPVPEGTMTYGEAAKLLACVRNTVGTMVKAGRLVKIEGWQKPGRVTTASVLAIKDGLDSGAIYRRAPSGYRAERWQHSLGYILVYRPHHPHANKDGYVPEHRLVMEESIGRVIDPEIEVVHHIDENPGNNALENLAVLSRQDHRRVHQGWQLRDGVWFKPCSGCKRLLATEENFYKRHAALGAVFHLCKSCCRTMRRSHAMTRAVTS